MSDQDLLELAFSESAAERQRRALREIGTLTARELQVLIYVAKRLDDHAIGHALHLSPNTIKRYVSRVLARLGCVNRGQAIAVVYDAAIALRHDQ